LAFAETLDELERAEEEGWTAATCERLSAALAGMADVLSEDETRLLQAEAARSAPSEPPASGRKRMSY